MFSCRTKHYLHIGRPGGSKEHSEYVDSSGIEIRHAINVLEVAGRNRPTLDCLRTVLASGTELPRGM